MTDFFAKDPQKPDLSDISVLFCTPCGSGEYEATFMSSLFATVKELERLGGKGAFAQFLYCADLSIARAKLLSSFYRSEHTHMMFIDSDMGWKPEDVVRLILQERDFIGAAGPKKKYPLAFAANMTDDEGTPLPVMQEGNGIIEVSEIGMAFMLISRACVERMVKSYPELEFDGDDDQVEHALFEPMIVKRRRYSEDYAFCRRWRVIGGRVLLLPDIRLKHTGKHTFEGAIQETFEDQDISYAGVSNDQAA